MAKTKISEYSTTASNNTDIDGISIAEGMAPSNVNNAIRELMSQLKEWQSGSVSQDMSVNGAFTATGNAVLSADLSVGDGLIVAGDASVGGAFTCTGAALLSSNLSVAGNASITGTLAATGATSLGAVTFSGAAVMSSTLAVTGNATVGSATTNAHILNGSLTAATSAKIFLDDSVTTATAPVLSWDTDTDTGLYRPAANNISVATGGIEQFRVTNDNKATFYTLGGFGYGTGVGASTTQTTSKSQGVTLNAICGQITMNSASLGAGAEVSFTLTNDKISSTDVVVLNISANATTNTYLGMVDAVANGSCRIFIRNMSGSSRSEALVLNFAVIKSVGA